LDSGFGLWLWTLALDSGFGLWLWTLALDSGFGLWLWTSGQQSLVGTDIDSTTTETSDFGGLAWIGIGV
jgi:hypothetical protein